MPECCKTEKNIMNSSLVLETSEQSFQSIDCTCTTEEELSIANKYKNDSLIICVSPASCISSPVLSAESPVALHHSTPIIARKCRRNTTTQKSGRCLSYSDTSSICSLLESECCKERCFAKLTLLEAENARERFKSKSTTQQNQFLLDSCAITSSACAQVSPKSLMLEGKSVCHSAFVTLLGVSSRRYKRIFSQSRSGVVQITRKPSTRGSSMKSTEALAWMNAYFDLIGEKMPHKNQIHLPHFLTKGDVYDIMKRELKDEGLTQVISSSHFYRLWNHQFKNVVIPAVSNNY